MLKTAILLVVAWGITRSLGRAVDRFRSDGLSWEGLRWWWLFVAAACYGLGLLPMAVFWRRVLRALGQSVGWRDTLRAYYIGHLGKYVPGKAMVVVLRAGLLPTGQIDRKLAAVSVFVETLTMMAVGAGWALAYLLVTWTTQRALQQLAAGLLLLTLLPTLPPVFRRIVVRLRLMDAAHVAQGRLSGYNLALVIQGWLASTVTWLLLGLSLEACLRAIPFYVPPLHAALAWPLYTASTALALVAGFLSLLPGGVLVREWVLDQMLAPQVGPAVALAAAVVLRLVWLLTELVVSGLLYAVRASQELPGNGVPADRGK